MDYRRTAQRLCQIIDSVSMNFSDPKRYNTPFGLDICLDGISYEADATGMQIDGYDEVQTTAVQLDNLAFPCTKFYVDNGIAVFECTDPSLPVQPASIGQIEDALRDASVKSVTKAVVKMRIGDKIEVAGIQGLENYEMHWASFGKNDKPLLVAGCVDLDKVLDLNFTPVVQKLAQDEIRNEMQFSESMRRLGKRFYEDEGGASAAGGDAGGAASAAPATGDFGDTAAEMNGTSVADVLGKCEPGKGYMGKDNFYIPAKAKCPLHRWEAANGGSKRKKKGKYSYEKGMKVVVSMFEDEMLNEKEAFSTYEALAGASWEEIKAKAEENARDRAKSQRLRFDRFAFEKSLDALHDRWEAAQLDPPDVAAHGELEACTLDEDKFKREYLKDTFIHGFYEDGTMFELGPMKRQIASAYLSLHKLSVNSKTFQKMKADEFSGVREIGKGPSRDDDELTVIRMKDGYWLNLPRTGFRAGPFDNKQLARMYAMSKKYRLEKKSPSDKSDQGYMLEYPTFSFSYTMAGVPCMDIVVAEDVQRAMKLFDYQWRMFDNTRPTRDKFNNIQDLQRDLALLRIKDIEIEQLDADDIEEYEELAKVTGNPSTIPELQSRCRNPRFKYVLGRENAKGGRLVVQPFTE